MPSEVVLNEEDAMKSPCAVTLHNAVTVSQQSVSIESQQCSGRRVAQPSAPGSSAPASIDSRGAAQECSPRREPWVESEMSRSPGGAKESYDTDSGATTEFRNRLMKSPCAVTQHSAVTVSQQRISNIA